jgi:glycosyltransferase involved in cell wall biosynthesis
MNILFLDQFSDLGGAQRCLLDLLPALRERGWTAHLAAPGTGPLLERARIRGAVLHHISCGPYSSGRKSVRDGIRFARDFFPLARDIGTLAGRYDVDLVYVNGPRLVPAAAWVLRRDRPLVFHCHSYLSQSYAASLIGQLLRRTGATVIASCRFVANPLLPYIAPESLEVIYNGVAGCPLAIESTQPRKGWRVGIIGRIAPEKGQREFLQAARILTTTLPGCRFVVCGGPLFSSSDAQRYFQEIQRLSEGLPVESLGWRENVCSVLSSLDLLVVPSAKVEATTRVILEAWSAGVPVVAYRAGGIPEIVGEGRTGYLADSPEPEALARKIQAVLSQPAHQLRAVAETARKTWQDNYTLTRYRAQVLALIERVAGVKAGQQDSHQER